MPLKSKINNDVINIIQNLRNASFETYIVGGAVRDLLLGIKPKDYDISTAATPEQIKSLFRRRAMIIGRRFKLVHYLAEKRIFEISTFRKEPAEHEKFVEVKGKLFPNENTYGTAEEDAWRRDFTVNAIFYDPVSDTIIDFTQMGEKDLKNGIVRIIGDPDKRFSEDPVRILRAIKLVGQYAFSIEEKTKNALFSSMPLIKKASTSRLSLEFEKILKHERSSGIIKAFIDYGFIDFFLPMIACEIRKDKRKEKLLLDILSEWNLRISQEEYRSSISIALAAISSPFVMDLIGLESFDSPVLPRIKTTPIIYEKIRSLIFPYTFPKRIVYVAINLIHMQQVLLKYKPNLHITGYKHFHHARELFGILNKTVWQKPELDTKWK